MEAKIDMYMLISHDKYELPLAVADTINELAKMLGKNPNTISSIMCHARKKGQWCRYIKVDV